MKLLGNLTQLIPAWPVDSGDSTKGHRALFASKATESAFTQPVVAWGLVDADGATNAVPLCWDAADGCLMPPTVHENFVALLEPGDDPGDFGDEVADTLASLADDSSDDEDSIPDPPGK